MSNINRRGGDGANAKDWVVTPSLKTVTLNTSGKFLDGNIEIQTFDNSNLEAGDKLTINLANGAEITINDLELDQSLTLVGGDNIIVEGGDAIMEVKPDAPLTINLANGGNLTIFDEASGKSFTLIGGFVDGDGVYYK